MSKYRFKKEYEDAVISLPTIKYPITKNNLTDKIAEKILKVPGLAHNIEAVNKEDQKQIENRHPGTEVDEFGNRILAGELKDAPPANDPLANATGDGDVVALKKSQDDIFVDEQSITDEEGEEESKPDPEYPSKGALANEARNVKPVSNKDNKKKR